MGTAAPYRGWEVVGAVVEVAVGVLGAGVLAGAGGSVAARTVHDATRDAVTKEAVNSQRRGADFNIVQ
jgi:hypothetical protein